MLHIMYTHLFSSDLRYVGPTPQIEYHFNLHTNRKEQHLKLAVIGTVIFPYYQAFILVRS